VSFCEDWSNDNIAVFSFTGGSIPEQQTTFGQIRVTVNGDTPVDLGPGDDPESMNIVEPSAIRGWASQESPGLSCGTGDFGPLAGQLGEWGPPGNGICALEPIPSLSATGKLLLTALVILGGAYLVTRSKALPSNA
jgi:hypothetical protein